MCELKSYQKSIRSAPGQLESQNWGCYGQLYLVFLWFVEFKVQPYRTLEGSGSHFTCFFETCEIQGATLSHFEGGRVTFTKQFFWFVEFNVQTNRTLEGLGPLWLSYLRFVKSKVQPYRISKVTLSLLPSLFEVCGVQCATLSNFGGAGVTFTRLFVVL
jgi:hypothetical protein